MSDKITYVGNGTTLGGTATPLEGLEQYRTFVAGAAITAGMWVSFDVSQTGTAKLTTVVKSPVVATGNPQCVGVATESVASGATVQVQIRGIYTDAYVADATAANDPIIAGGTTAGMAETAAATDISAIVGWAITDGSGANAATVYIANPAGL